jgi:LAO/AO transport system kinase
MEIADVMVVNKADRPGSEKIVSELQNTMQMKEIKPGDWEVSVIATEAVNDKNVDRLYARISEHVEYCRNSGYFEKHRRERIKKKILNILKNRFQTEFLNRLTDQVEFNRLIDEIYEGKASPYTIGDQLYRQFSAT